MSLHILDEIAQIADDWLWESDPDDRITYLSAEAERFLGCAPATLLGLRRDGWAWEPDAERFQAYRRALAGRQPFRGLIYAYRHPDGAPRWFELSGRPRFSVEGIFLGYRGVGRDVSDEHRTRDALAEALTRLQDANGALVEQNRRFDAALENMTQGLCLFDAEHRLLVWNRRYREIYALDHGALRVGITQREIIERLVELGRYKAGATVDSVSEGTRTSLTHEGAKSVMRELSDGRVIAAMHRPMEGGAGWRPSRT